MDNALIIDGVLLLVLIVGYCIGAKRGLFKSLMGFAVVIVALIGSMLIANVLTEPVTDLIYPAVEEKITARFESAYSDEQVTDALKDAAQNDIEAFLNGKVSDEFVQLLERIGIKAETIRTFLDDVTNSKLVSTLRDSAKESAAAAVSAMAYAMVHTAVQAVLSLVLFLLLLIVLKLFTRLFDHVFDLPVLKTLNDVGGGVLGLLEVLLFVYLALWLAPRFGITFLRDKAEHTYLLKFFSTYTPLTLIASLNGGK